MKNRNKAYYRHQRNRTIKRKKFIAEQILGRTNNEPLGKLAKGKVHCSCRLCKFEKHYNLPKEIVSSRLRQMDYEIKIYRSSKE